MCPFSSSSSSSLCLSLSPLSLSQSLPPPSPPSLSLYDRCLVNRYAFSCFFKVTRHWLCLTCTGSEIQVAVPRRTKKVNAEKINVIAWRLLIKKWQLGLYKITVVKGVVISFLTLIIYRMVTEMVIY